MKWSPLKTRVFICNDELNIIAIINNITLIVTPTISIVIVSMIVIAHMKSRSYVEDEFSKMAGDTSQKFTLWENFCTIRRITHTYNHEPHRGMKLLQSKFKSYTEKKNKIVELIYRVPSVVITIILLPQAVCVANYLLNHLFVHSRPNSTLSKRPMRLVVTMDHSYIYMTDSVVA